MAQWIATIPWWFIVSLALAGVILLVYGNKRINTAIRSAGLLAVSLALLLMAAHFLIDTDAERMTRRTEQIIDAVDKKDWPRMQSLLDEKTQVSLAGQGTDCRGKDIGKVAEQTANHVGLKDVSIITKKTEQFGDQIVVTLTAATMQNETLDRPIASGWEFDYDRNDKIWTLSHIKLLSLENQPLQ